MARPRTLLDLLDQLAPEVQKAFLQSFESIRSDVQLNLMIGALERGDIEGAMRFLNIETAYFAPLDQALMLAYTDGGDWAIQGIRNIAKRQGATIVGRFDARNPRAEEYLRNTSSRLIVEIVADQREGIRAALTANMTEGVSPRKAALDVVGRINRTTGRREGGKIGLTQAQSQYADNALAQLRSGDPVQMKQYLTRAARDRRFDRTVMAAIQSGKPISAADAAKMANRYKDILLRKRGETIARTELLGSLHAAQDEAEQQLIDAGKISRDMIDEEWDAANDKDTRDSHAFMDSQKPDANGIYTTGAGYRMKHPGDTSLGAPAKEIILCRCTKRKSYDFISSLRNAA